VIASAADADAAQVHDLSLTLGDGVAVAATVHLPASDRAVTIPVLLLPGARGDHAAEHLVALARLLAAAGHPVMRAALRPHPPGAVPSGRAEAAVDRLLAVLAAARTEVARRVASRVPRDARSADTSRSDGTASAAPDGSVAWIVGGASFGGRVASLAVARAGGAAIAVRGLLLVAYPLHPPGRPERLRVAHWPDVDVPVLMLSGDRDPFLTPALLAEHRGALGGDLTLVTVPGGGHDLRVSARAAPDGRRRSPAEAVAEAAADILPWATAVGE
jgi:uncharacterized protein